MPLVKSLIFEFLRLPGINAALKAFRPVFARFDLRAVDKFPVRGSIPIRFQGRTVFVMESDGRDSVASGAFWVGLDAYEGCTLTVFAHFAKTSHQIVDVGANTGLFSLLAASLNKDAVIHAFEPFPGAADLLEANLRANRFGTIHLVRAAVADQPGTLPLYYNDALRLTQGASLRNWDYVTGKVDVPVMRLDDYLAERGIETIDLLKVDVEGAEPEVLAGAENTIARCTPDIFCELIKEDCFPKLRAFIQRHGYRAYRLAGAGLVPDFELAEKGPVAWNRLFIHPSRLDRLQPLLPATAS
ncbi:MAG: FkbM family methyltransferase [Verrucomicrobiales bacterium]